LTDLFIESVEAMGDTISPEDAETFMRDNSVEDALAAWLKEK